MNPKSKPTLTLRIERPAYGGISISRHQGKVVLVNGAFIPGESVEAVIEKEKKDYLSVSVLKLLEPSPERITPECEYFGNCGGCHLQHIPYDLQVTLKQDILSDCLKRIGKIDTQLSDPLISDSPWNYRLRAQFKISGNNIGFFMGKTHIVVNIESCPLMDHKINPYYQKARDIISLNKTITELHLISGDSTIALIKLSAGQESSPDLEQLAVQFIEAGFSGLIMENENRERFGYGTTYTTLDLAGIQYSVSPSCFFQSNWTLNVQLIDHIKHALAPLSDKDILDLYAGSGNFSLPLAEADRVVAIEESKPSIENGKRSIAMNEIKNFTFITSSAEDYMTDDQFDIVITDPPRTGLKSKVINNLLSMMPERIVYISCNPTTLARDLKMLAEKYDIESVRLVDFFPQTYHIESLVFLTLR